MWVIFEGLDKSGKGTLEKEFLKATNFKHIVIDRGPAGYLTFDEIFKRGTKEDSYNFVGQAHMIMDTNQFMIVYCVVDEKIAQERLKAHNETCPYNYTKAQKIYDENIIICYDKESVLKLDTTNRSVEECIALIIEKLQEALKRSEYN